MRIFAFVCPCTARIVTRLMFCRPPKKKRVADFEVVIVDWILAQEII